jgi:hypothetical protein
VFNHPFAVVPASFAQRFTSADTSRVIIPLCHCYLHNSATIMPSAPKQRKIAIVGNRSVGVYFLLCISPSKLTLLGKSSLTVRFVEHHFVESYYPTIENTFSRIIKYNGQDYATEIVDTAGQVRIPPKFRLLGPDS